MAEQEWLVVADMQVDGAEDDDEHFMTSLGKFTGEEHERDNYQVRQDCQQLNFKVRHIGEYRAQAALDRGDGKTRKVNGQLK